MTKTDGVLPSSPVRDFVDNEKINMPSSLKYYYRRLTSSFRRLPDFIIIGAQKSGTSSLFYYLSQHPSLNLSVTKEIHYYNYYTRQGKNIGWYKSFFPLKVRSINKKTGEASPYYLFEENAAKQLKRDIPTIKLIVILRNPIDRAYSAYNMNVSQGTNQTPQTFEQAIANTDLSVEASQVYLIRGQYAAHIKKWLKYFERDQFLFIKSEVFFENPRSTLEKVYKFLGIDEHYPDNLRAQEVGSYSKITTQTRTQLEDYFKRSNQELVELLGKEFQW